MRQGSLIPNPVHPFRTLLRPFCATLLIATTAAALACNSKPDHIEVLSFRNAEKPETFVENFPPGYFRMNSEKAYEIVLELEPRLLEVPPHEDDTSDATSQPAPPDLVWTSQLLHIRILWKPIPGKTYAESTQTNAAIVYCLVNGDNTISYEGAGFVFFKLSRDGDEMEGRIESSSLRPTRFGREPVDLFGPCRISGTFKAAEGSRKVANVRQRLRRLLGKPSTGIEGPN